MDYILSAERKIWHQERKIRDQLASFGFTQRIPPVERLICQKAILSAIQSVDSSFVREASLDILATISGFAEAQIVTCQNCAQEFLREEGEHLVTYLRRCFRCHRSQFCYNCASQVAFGNGTGYFDCRALGGGEGGPGACYTTYESNMCLIL